MVTFTIKGQPMGKQRPKFSTYGGFVKTYTPKETVNYETLVKMSYYGLQYFGDEPLKVTIKAYYQIPKSYSKKKRLMAINGELRPITKPDCDNIAKIICDALNSVAYDDDKQIVELVVQKYYAEEPRTEVTIE